MIYNNKISTFKQLLKQDGSVSIHTKNLRFIAVEMFKVAKTYAPKIFSDLFPLKEQNNYSLRQKSFFKMPRTKTVCITVSKASHI